MENLLRLILRLVLVPLGLAVAVAVAMAVLVSAYWSAFAAVLGADPVQQQNWFLALFLYAPLLLAVLVYSAMMMLAPGVLFILLAEAFAFRSVLYHAGAGGLSALIGWLAISDMRDRYQFLDNPMAIVGAGIAAGFAYWLIAGWTSGFWRPIGRSARQPVATLWTFSSKRSQLQAFLLCRVRRALAISRAAAMPGRGARTRLRCMPFGITRYREVTRKPPSASRSPSTT
jgi:hypothetical protein